MTYRGNDILRLIPQRHPFVMVDTLERSDNGSNTAIATLAVRQDNYFIMPDGTLAETGLIEHIAQSCSALAGCIALDAQNDSTDGQTGQTAAPPVGIIGEVKHFTCHRRPLASEQLRTTVTFDMTFGNVTMATGATTVGDEPIAEIKLKIFMQ